MEIIEKTGLTVEDAVSEGLKELGVGPEDVMIEVISEPSRGLLGLGGKPAHVRIVLLRRREDIAKEKEAAAASKPKPERNKKPRRSKPKSRPSEPRIEDRELPPPVVVPDEEADEDAVAGKAVLAELIEKMGIEATVSIVESPTPSAGEEKQWVLNVTGEDMRNLIGRRGDTLASLQYITRLIVSRRLQRRANIIVDVDQYKHRRADRLEQLANRMADQAVDRGRKVTLEPMPPHERRIIHVSLRQREDVTTESIGEGRYRKVTILPM